MKIIILSICVFIMLRNTFFLSSPNILFPIPEHKGPLFFNFQSIGNGRRKSKHPPSSAFGWWKFMHELWNREKGNGDVCGMWMTPWWGTGHGEEEEDGGGRWHRARCTPKWNTEPKYSSGWWEQQKVEAAQGGKYRKNTSGSNHQTLPCVFGRNPINQGTSLPP